MSEQDDLKSAETAAKLLARVKRLEVRPDKKTPASKSNENTFDSIAEFSSNVGIVANTILHIKEGAHWLYQKVLIPLAQIFPFINTLWTAYKNFWHWFCYPSAPLYQSVTKWGQRCMQRISCRAQNLFRKVPVNCVAESKQDSGKFSKSRAGIFVLLTLLILAWPLRIPLAKDISFALCYELPYDATRMGINVLWHGGHFGKERLYLNGKNEIDPHANIWSVSGCEHATDCPPSDAVYFRVKPSVAHMLWSLITKQQIFISDDIAGVIPNVPSACDVKYYGARLRVLRWMQSYPVVLDVKCQVLE